MADPNHDSTSPEAQEPEAPIHETATPEDEGELHAVQSLQRYLKGSGNRPAANARVVSSEAEIVLRPPSPFNATDFLGLNAEVEGLLRAAEARSQGSAAEGSMATIGSASAARAGAQADGDSQGWLLDLDAETAERAGRRPVLSDPAREAGLAVARGGDSSFVEPEVASDRARRQVLRLVAAAAVIGAGLAVWRMVVDGDRGDGAPQSVDIDVVGTARGDHAPQVALDPQRRGLNADGSWRTVPSGDLPPGLDTGAPSDGSLARAEPTPAPRPAPTGHAGRTEPTGAQPSAGTVTDPEPSALAVLEGFDALLEGEEAQGGVRGPGADRGQATDHAERGEEGTSLRHLRTIGPIPTWLVAVAQSAGTANLAGVSSAFAGAHSLVAELIGRPIDRSLRIALRPVRPPAGPRQPEPWELAEPLAAWPHIGEKLHPDRTRLEEERYASAAEDAEPAPFVGLEDVLGRSGLTFADADRLAREGLPEPIDDGVDPLSSFVDLARVEGLPADSHSGRDGRFAAAEIGAWMLFGEEPASGAGPSEAPGRTGALLAAPEVPRTQVAAEHPPRDAARTQVEPVTADSALQQSLEVPGHDVLAEVYPEDEDITLSSTSDGAESPERRRARRYSVLRRADDHVTNHYWGRDVVMELIESPERIYTPNVGIVHVETDTGEVFVGRLNSMGSDTVWLQAEPGKLALKGSTVAAIRAIDAGRGPWPPSWQIDPATSGLPEVRVRVAGGFLEGRLFAHDGDRVTIITGEGGRITVRSNEVQPAGRRRPASTIKGRIEGE